jgi:hypothetical protein
MLVTNWQLNDKTNGIHIISLSSTSLTCVAIFYNHLSYSCICKSFVLHTIRLVFNSCRLLKNKLMLKRFLHSRSQTEFRKLYVIVCKNNFNSVKWYLMLFIIIVRYFLTHCLCLRIVPLFDLEMGLSAMCDR